ncbi:MAG: DNA repair protein RecN [Isosphaeraceae bacterium]
MLRELSVQNLALIEDVRIELSEGFCAWTGETGAGKSLLLTALGLALGGKAAPDLVRSGKDEARAAAVFEVSDPTLRLELEAILGGPLDDGLLILTRRVTAQGRGSAQANGLPVTVATLRALGDRLISIHGQAEGRALADPEQQRSMLDAYGALAPLLLNYRRHRDAHEGLRRRRLELMQKVQDRRRERALLEFERDELAAADPRRGEADALAQESRRLACAVQVRTTAAEGFALLYASDRSAQGLLATVAHSITPLAATVPKLAEAIESLDRLAEETREVAYSLRNLGQGWEDDPDRLEEIEDRLALYRRLAARFHCTTDELADRRAENETRLATLDQDEADLAGVDLPLASAWNALCAAAQSLSEGRRKAAKLLARSVQARLKSLGFDKARLSIACVTTPLGVDPTVPPPPACGADEVEFFFSANSGEEPAPLRKVASGGELSRVTLAVKAALAGADRVSTLVFDEIDTGVGGRLGAVLGRTLAELAQHHQVICVTHLPQLASYAQVQWVIRKHEERGRTRTTITPLGEKDRVVELAEMIRGDSAAEGTRREAQAMLLDARATFR